MPPPLMRYASQAMAQAMLRGMREQYARKLGELRVIERDAIRRRYELRKLALAIKLFDAEWSRMDAIPIRPKRPSRWGGRGRGMRTFIEVLSETRRPLTANEIAVKALAKHGQPVPPYNELRKIIGSLSGALRRRIGKDVVCHPGEPNRWSLTRS